MTTIGDVLLILAVLTVTSLALWGTMVATSLLFPYKAAKLANTVERRPWASLITGFFMTVPVLIFVLILANVPSPAVKILAFLIFLLFMTVAAVGGSGQIRLIADRVKATYGDVPMFGALTRASAIVILVFNIPFVGWFLMAPMSLMAGIGSLTLNILRPAKAPEAEANGS